MSSTKSYSLASSNFSFFDAFSSSDAFDFAWARINIKIIYNTKTKCSVSGNVWWEMISFSACEGTLSWVLWVAKCLCMLWRRWNLHPQTTQEYGFTIVLHQKEKMHPNPNQPTCALACASQGGTSRRRFDHTWDREPSNRIGTHKKRVERKENWERKTTQGKKYFHPPPQRQHWLLRFVRLWPLPHLESS